jgi:hypothetical protein
MEPRLSATVIVASVAAVLLAGGGFLAGRSTAVDPSDALAEQTAAIQAQGASIAAVSELVGRPVVIDAELRATLAEVPVQCRRDMGGDPMGVSCQWATCLQFGQSAAQRPECRAVEALMVESLGGCPDGAP